MTKYFGQTLVFRRITSVGEDDVDCDDGGLRRQELLQSSDETSPDVSHPADRAKGLLVESEDDGARGAHCRRTGTRHPVVSIAVHSGCKAGPSRKHRGEE